MRFIGFILLIIIITGILTWGNYRYSIQNPGGNDFLVHWIGTRLLVTQGISPYSDDAAAQIQQFAYGRLANEGEHELRPAYPLYSIIILLPFSLIKDYALSRSLWMTFLEVCLVINSILCMRLVDWHPKPLILLFLLLFTVFWYHGLRPIINGNIVALIALMITGALVSIRLGEYELAGVLLAFSTIKPQVILLILIFIITYSISIHKWKLVIWFAGTVILLSVSSALIMPDWPLQNLREIIRYQSYNPPTTIQAAMNEWLGDPGKRIGAAISIAIILILIFEWRISLASGIQHFIWTACITLVLGQWIGIPTDPGNFVVLMPSLILVLKILEYRFPRLGRVFVVIGIISLFVIPWLVFLLSVSYGDQPQQSALMFLPVPVILALELYWIRWWTINNLPQRFSNGFQ